MSRPFRAIVPHYDELISSLCYAIFIAATGLHAVLFHLLTRKDVCASCFDPPVKDQVEIITQQAAPAISTQVELAPHHHQHHHPHVAQVIPHHAETSIETDRERAIVHAMDPAIADEMNVTIMDPSMIVNSFYDPRQSKTARRFFQKQKLLQQMQNNQLHRHQSHHHHHRHSRHSSGHSINNAHSYRSHSSHSPITEEALLNASTSSKAKVSNVNIHVEIGAYDWHELQSRLSDNSWSKSGKQLLPRASEEHGNPRAASRSEMEIQDTAREERVEIQAPSASRSTYRTDKGKRKRHVIYHQRIPKKSKLEDQASADVATSENHLASFERCSSIEKPSYVFADKEYRERTLAKLGSNDEAMRTLTAGKMTKVLDESVDECSYQKRETSV